jgi:ATP-dependent Clp protease ATP-binding subunit ClpC
MRRAIQKELEDPLSTMLLEGNYPLGAAFIANGEDGKIAVRPVLKNAGYTVPEKVQQVVL